MPDVLLTPAECLILFAAGMATGVVLCVLATCVAELIEKLTNNRGATVMSEPIFTPKQWRYLIGVVLSIALSVLVKKGVIDSTPPPVVAPVLPPEFFEGQKRQEETIKRIEADVLKALMQMPPAVQKH